MSADEQPTPLNVGSATYAKSMLHFDASQLEVLDLNRSQHARILGAPGSGKTALVAETYALVLDLPNWHESDVLAWAPSRTVASRLRERIEQRVAGALSGIPARTPVAFAFSVLQRDAAKRGATAPRLLTGTAQDQVIAHVVSSLCDHENLSALRDRLSTDVLLTESFRTEIRDFSRVLDDFAFQPDQFGTYLAQKHHRQTGAGEAQMSPDQQSLWESAAFLCDVVRRELRLQRPNEFSSSELLAQAAVLVREDTEIPVPSLLLVDDAQELTEGELALMAALASRGCAVWAFGDPDSATGAFQGEHVRVLAGMQAEFARRGTPIQAEQTVVLRGVHRHGQVIRELVQQLSARIGTAGAGAQRQAESFCSVPNHPDDSVKVPDAVQFAQARSVTEQLGAVAHRLRRRRLGIDTGSAIPWGQLAVLCRSRADVLRVARVLTAHEVPTNIAAGGQVLSDHNLVRELIILTQYACGFRDVQAAELWEILNGEIGGVDTIALRRFRAELRLREQRRARLSETETLSCDEIIVAAFASPTDQPLIDARSARQLRRLGSVVRDARTKYENGATPREVLWAVWEGAGLAEPLQRVALEESGAPSARAHEALDAAMGLFFRLQRHEEQDSSQPVAELLTELLVSAVSEDSLAARSERDCVTITTPQGAVGQEFTFVCILGPQDGAWPNVKARGSLLEHTACERWLRGQTAAQPSRRDTLHDELRLFMQACSRATDELLVVAVSDEENHPSPFFGFGRSYLLQEFLPSTRLTVRGAVAEMRRRMTANDDDEIALQSLVSLANIGAPGAHPDEWYGVLPLSTDAPLVDLAGDETAVVSVSPSRMEAAERCPLDWVIGQLGGSKAGAVQQLGTLLHLAFEHGEELPSASQIYEAVSAQWHLLDFEAEWQSEGYREKAKEMAIGISAYLSDFSESSRELIGSEVPLQLKLGQVMLNGTADRLEAVQRADGETELSVVDLKTGKKFPSGTEIAEHAQLQAYQLGVLEGGYQLPESGHEYSSHNGGARLLYVDPSVRVTRGADAGNTYRVASQAQLSPEARDEFIERIQRAAQMMSAGTFIAQLEHHCQDSHMPGKSCALHIIPGVSHV